MYEAHLLDQGTFHSHFLPDFALKLVWCLWHHHVMKFSLMSLKEWNAISSHCSLVGSSDHLFSRISPCCCLFSFLATCCWCCLFSTSTSLRLMMTCCFLFLEHCRKAFEVFALPITRSVCIHISGNLKFSILNARYRVSSPVSYFFLLFGISPTFPQNSYFLALEGKIWSYVL